MIGSNAIYVLLNFVSHDFPVWFTIVMHYTQGFTDFGIY